MLARNNSHVVERRTASNQWFSLLFGRSAFMEESTTNAATAPITSRRALMVLTADPALTLIEGIGVLDTIAAFIPARAAAATSDAPGTAASWATIARASAAFISASKTPGTRCNARIICATDKVDGFPPRCSVVRVSRSAPPACGVDITAPGL